MGTAALVVGVVVIVVARGEAGRALDASEPCVFFPAAKRTGCSRILFSARGAERTGSASPPATSPPGRGAVAAAESQNQQREGKHSAQPQGQRVQGALRLTGRQSGRQKAKRVLVQTSVAEDKNLLASTKTRLLAGSHARLRLLPLCRRLLRFCRNGYLARLAACFLKAIQRSVAEAPERAPAEEVLSFERVFARPVDPKEPFFGPATSPEGRGGDASAGGGFLTFAEAKTGCLRP